MWTNCKRATHCFWVARVFRTAIFGANIQDVGLRHAAAEIANSVRVSSERKTAQESYIK